MPLFLRLLPLLAVLLLAACGQDAPPKAEPRSIKAKALRLSLTEARECTSLPGQVQSRNSVTLASKVSGTVTEILAKEGDSLAAGQTILRIDDAELRQREQGVRSTAGQASLEGKALAARRAQAKATFERMQKLLDQNAISRDDVLYHAWPDVALTPSGKLVCVFSECTHHGDRSYTRIMACDSTDRGRSWTPKRPVTDPTHGLPVHWNCARITQLRDGRLAVLVDKLSAAEGSAKPEECRNFLFFSSD